MTKSEASTAGLRGVLTASTPPSLVSPRQSPELPRVVPLLSESPQPRLHQPPDHSPSQLRPTPHRLLVLSSLLRCRLLTGDQLKVAIYPPGGDSRCQYDLTQMVRHRWIDRLPRRSVIDKTVYLLSRKSTVGNEIVRLNHGEAAFRRGLTRFGAIDHLLGINEVRVRVERGCTDNGWNLLVWQTAEELQRVMPKAAHLIPDSFFRIERGTPEGAKRSSFFLEVERSVKSQRVLVSKLARYADFYRRDYQATFGAKRLRGVLFVFTSEWLLTGQRRVELALDIAKQANVPFAHFTSLDALCAVAPSEVFTAEIWWRPDHPEPIALYSV
jgi:hypothetical protein